MAFIATVICDNFAMNSELDLVRNVWLVIVLTAHNSASV